MRVGDRTGKKPPLRRESTEKLIRRIEKNNNGKSFDPNALLNLLEENGEDDEVSFRSDASPFARNKSNFDDDSVISAGQRSGAAAAAAGQQRMSSSVMSRQSRQSNVTMITHINNNVNQLPISPGTSVHTYAPPPSVVSRQSNATLMTHINHNFSRNSSSGASFQSDSSSMSGSTLSFGFGNISSAIATAKQTWRNCRGNVNIWGSVFVLILLFSLYNMSLHRQSLGMYRDYTAESIIPSKITELRGAGGETDAPFVMCGRETPFRYNPNPATDRSVRQGPQKAFNYDWPKENKILLLRNDGKFGNVGNQMNSLLHAFDYARDHNLHLGMLFHSWAMDVIHSMFYETDDFDALGDELKNDFGILVVRNQTQLTMYDEVVSKNAEQLYFYRSSNKNMDHWRETMTGKSFLFSKRRIAFFG
jgi:hypothetical protein